MTVEQMKIIEPRLKDVQEYVEIQNTIARFRKMNIGLLKFTHPKVYWIDVWKGAKKRQKCLIGLYARNTQLKSSECWVMWHDHLKAIAKDCI